MLCPTISNILVFLLILSLPQLINADRKRPSRSGRQWNIIYFSDTQASSKVKAQFSVAVLRSERNWSKPKTKNFPIRVRSERWTRAFIICLDQISFVCVGDVLFVYYFRFKCSVLSCVFKKITSKRSVAPKTSWELCGWHMLIAF